MKIDFTLSEMRLLKRAGSDPKKEYSVDEMMDLLQFLYDEETTYARNAEKSDYASEQAERYAALADKVYMLIPE